MWVFKKYLIGMLLLLMACFSCTQAKYPDRLEEQTYEELAKDVVNKMAPFTANVYVSFVFSEDTNMAQVSCSLTGEYCVVELYKEEMDRVKLEYGDEAVVFVLAHELGHIQQFYPYTLDSSNSQMHELEADTAAGCIVKLLGYPDYRVKEFIYKELQTEDEFSTHPSASLRLDAFENGYNCTEN